MRTRVGYAGGTKKNPSYHSLGDHTETIEIEYDPARITYKQLLDVFWESHDPTVPSWSRQYRSVIFVDNEEQKKLAEESRAEEEKRVGTVHTAIGPLGAFYRAEAYHQKYLLRQARGLAKEIEAIYPDDEAFMNSTAAARLNGYLGGWGSAEELPSEIDRLGLSEKGKRNLRDAIADGSHLACGLPKHGSSQ